MRKGLLLYNPAAGRFPVRRHVRGIIKPLNDAGWNMDIAETLSGTHAVQTAHQAAQEKYDAVFAIGGDGTVGQVASGLIHTETALGVLPAGTVNVWALEQGQKPYSWWQPGNLKENAKLLSNVEPQYVDVGDCNDQPFLLWAGVGLDAHTINKIEPRPRIFKHIAFPHYFVTTVWEATFWHGLDLRIYAEGKLVEGHYLVAVATNIRHYAGGQSLISPNALLDDNEMDLWLLSGSNVADALRHYFDLVAGRHLTSEEARCIPFHHVTIESDANFSIQVDGDPMLGGHKAEIKVKHRALKVLVPENALYLLKTPQR
ncbi:MAG TPA: YegS/Rv2252/BmrU family lipid kinase [Anaerolineales bacterium]|nr:YegS/Rv2252/BmrU family lipid kinase [Anaerolineales bacterium]HNO93556.1 YegS/Rv2252/BmrU family lipid kinase [Anaerolineales bacterium]